MATALLFIPDITGFTHFVTSNEHDHHSHIITELLELLIDSNELDMELTEIEGDALFFHTTQLPTADKLFEQIQKMYLRFHQHLRLYDTHRICQCGACTRATGLGLKFFVHIGDVEIIKIKKNEKLHGREVIKIHRLMKNSVPIKEYALLTKELIDFLNQNTPSALLNGAYNWQKGVEDFGMEDVGKVPYQYQDLSDWKNKIVKTEIIYADKVKRPLHLSTQIDASVHQCIELLSDLRYRMQWNQFIKRLEYNEKEINRLGTKHICVIGQQTMEIETVKNDFGVGKWVYGERSPLPLDQSVTIYYIVERAQEQITQLKMEVHFQLKAPLKWLLRPLLHALIRQKMQVLLEDFKRFAEKQSNSKVSLQEHQKPCLSSV